MGSDELRAAAIRSSSLLLMSSLTDEQVLVANGYSFFPKKFSGASYAYIFQSGDTIMQVWP